MEDRLAKRATTICFVLHQPMSLLLAIFLFCVNYSMLLPQLIGWLIARLIGRLNVCICDWRFSHSWMQDGRVGKPQNNWCLFESIPIKVWTIPGTSQYLLHTQFTYVYYYYVYTLLFRPKTFWERPYKVLRAIVRVHQRSTCTCTYVHFHSNSQENRSIAGSVSRI